MASKFLAGLSYRVFSMRLSSPAERPFDDVALFVFEPIEQLG